MSFRLGEGAMIFDVLEDQSSLDDVGIFAFFLSPFRNIVPLFCFGIGFPLDLLPVWGFLFASGSALLTSFIFF